MTRAKILIVDDDKVFTEKLRRALDGLFDVSMCHSESAFRETYAIGKYDLLILDMRLDKDREGLDILNSVLRGDPMQAAVIMTAYADMETYSTAIRSGALNYFDKQEFSPVLIARTIEAIMRQGILRKRVVDLEYELVSAEPLEIIAVSPALNKAKELIHVAITNKSLPVLITGEPGTGKHLVARNIHKLSNARKNKPFKVSNLSATFDVNPARALFGAIKILDSERYQESIGLLDQAVGGVLYIDEISDLDKNTVKQLINFQKKGCFSRVGGHESISQDVQLIFGSTHVDQQQDLVKEPLQNMIVRLGGVEINIPALRERPEDIPLLAQYFVQHMYRLGFSKVRSIRGSAIKVLESMEWAGNVRELKSALEFASIRANASGVIEIGPEHLPQNSYPPKHLDVYDTSTLDYQLHLVRAELGLIENTIDLFKITQKGAIAEKLNYNDRYIFSRRIRKKLEQYPTVAKEFPKTRALFAKSKVRA